MLTKPGVVIIKHGDKEVTDAIEKGIGVGMYTKEQMTEVQRERDFYKKHIIEELEEKIADAEARHGYNYIPPTWAQKVIGVYALIMYGVQKFIDKYLRL